jgi:hypothetical protein
MSSTQEKPAICGATLYVDKVLQGSPANVYLTGRIDILFMAKIPYGTV